VIDCEWPDYLETMRFLRGEAGSANLVVVALLAADTNAQRAYEHGADLIAYKPVASTRPQRILATAFSLLRRKSAGF
jgi:DNA-binding NarL/FixJ family response regulator